MGNFLCLFHHKKKQEADVKLDQDKINKKLFTAVRMGNVLEIKECIHKGANINSRHHDFTVLSSALWEGNPEIFRLLLKLGADVNAKNSDGDTVLLPAILEGQLEIIQILLDSGANIYAENYRGMSPLQYAIWKNNPDILQLLQSKKMPEQSCSLVSHVHR